MEVKKNKFTNLLLFENVQQINSFWNNLFVNKNCFKSKSFLYKKSITLIHFILSQDFLILSMEFRLPLQYKIMMLNKVSKVFNLKCCNLIIILYNISRNLIKFSISSSLFNSIVDKIFSLELKTEPILK